VYEGPCGGKSDSLPTKFTSLLEKEDTSLQMPPVLLCCGESDVVLPSSRAVLRLMKARGLPCRLEIYPGNHAFFGIPPGWTFGACHCNAMPCARDLLGFLELPAETCTAAPLDARSLEAFKSGDRWVTMEWFGLLVYSEMALLLPLIPGLPVLLLSYLRWGCKAAAVKWVLWFSRRIAAFWGAFVLLDATRAVLRRDLGRKGR